MTENELLRKFFHNLATFIQIAPGLLTATTIEEFGAILTQCEKTDRRSLYLYLKAHKEEIKEEYLHLAQTRFLQEI